MAYSDHLDTKCEFRPASPCLYRTSPRLRCRSNLSIRSNVRLSWRRARKICIHKFCKLANRTGAIRISSCTTDCLSHPKSVWNVRLLTETIAPSQPKLTTAERQRIQAYVEKQMPNLQQALPTLMEKFWDILKKSIGGFLGVTGFLLSLILVPIYLFFLLNEKPRIEQHWKEYLPLRASPLRDEVAEVLSQINSYVTAYFRGQLLVCLVDGILIGTTLTVFGLNFAPVIGAMVVVLTMIPYIGIIICWVPAVLIAAFQWGDWTHPLIVTGIFIAIQNLEGIFYAPRIVGNYVGLHPMTVIVSIFVWGLIIGGLIGPLLAVPLTATVKVLLGRYVWGRRLREKIEDSVKSIPVVEEPEVAIRS